MTSNNYCCRFCWPDTVSDGGYGGSVQNDESHGLFWYGTGQVENVHIRRKRKSKPWGSQWVDFLWFLSCRLLGVGEEESGTAVESVRGLGSGLFVCPVQGPLFMLVVGGSQFSAAVVICSWVLDKEEWRTWTIYHASFPKTAVLLWAHEQNVIRPGWSRPARVCLYIHVFEGIWGVCVYLRKTPAVCDKCGLS